MAANVRTSTPSFRAILSSPTSPSEPVHPQYENGIEATPHSCLEPTPQNFPELAYTQHNLGFIDERHDEDEDEDEVEAAAAAEPTYFADLPLPYPVHPPSLSRQTAASPDTSTDHVITQLPPSQQGLRPDSGWGEKRKTICGCSILVFILSCILALLSAAVIGLAAGIGIEAQRANDASMQLAVASASLSAILGSGGGGGNSARASGGSADRGISSEATPTPVTTFAPPLPSDVTPLAASGMIDDGCAADPAAVTGTNYTTFTCMNCLIV